jgi:uncharacterized protein
MKRSYLLLPVPSFILKVILGEMSNVVLEGSRISSQKIIDAGYRFLFPDLQKALNDIINEKSN